MSLLPVLLAACAGAVWPAAGRGGLERLASGPGSSSERSGSLRSEPPGGGRRRRWLAVLAAVGVWVGLGGSAGLVLGAAAGAGGWWALGRLPDRAAERAQRRLLSQLPLALDLLAGALAAGLGFPAAMRAVAHAAEVETSERFAPVAVALARGLSPAEAWAAWRDPPELAAVARVLVRAADSGAAPAATITALADRRRAASHARSVQRVRAAGVWAVLPLGLCFLPAFVLAAVVPVVAGLLHHLW